MSLLSSRATLLAFFASMTVASVAILATERLANTERYLMKSVLAVQFIAVASLLTGARNVLYFCHLMYIIMIIVASSVASNIAVVVLLLATIVCAKISVTALGDCPFHEHSDRVSLGAGGSTTFLTSDNALYAVCIVILLVRLSATSTYNWSLVYPHG